MKVHQVGFLNVASDFAFEGGELIMSPDFRRARHWVEKYANEDGFFYPPLSHRVSIDIDTGKESKIPKTTRPALLYKMPHSHDLVLKGTGDVQRSRLGLAGFVVHCFAFLFGTRLQFSDWWVEGRIPIKSTVNVHVSPKIAENFVSKAIHTRKSFDQRSRMIASNMLYLYAKSGSLEWDWERFQMEYTVFDACYALISRLRSWRPCPHKKRLERVCECYGLRYNGRLVRKFIYLRNNLIHEALWDGSQVGTPRSSASFIASFQLRNFNHRLITAVLTGETEYTRSPWWYLGPFAFKV